jgi:hypothetical protein
MGQDDFANKPCLQNETAKKTQRGRKLNPTSLPMEKQVHSGPKLL